MELSKHFSLEEFTNSDVAVRKGIDNTPSAEIVENLKMVASVLEVIRELAGLPVRISSGYRCAALNRVIGGVASSAHVQGLAADISVPGMTPKELAVMIRDAGIVLDQLIFEGTWVHVGLALEAPRKQVLTANFAHGKASYVEGIV